MVTGRMEHVGGAPATGLQAGIGAGDLSLTLLSGTGYPTGAVGKFVLALDPLSATEEHILCTARSGATITVDAAGRGYDNTTAQSHSAGTTNVEHIAGAFELDDYNAHIYVTTRDDHPQYARVDGTRAFTGGITGTTATFSGAGSFSGAVTATGIVTASSFVQTSHHLFARVSQAAAFNPVAPAVFKFDTTESDPAGMYSAASGFFTVPSSGLYAIKAQLSVTTDGTHPSSGLLQIFKQSGSVVLSSGENLTIPVSTTTAVPIYADVILTAADAVGIKSQLSVAAGEVGVPGTTTTYCTIYYVGPMT